MIKELSSKAKLSKKIEILRQKLKNMEEISTYSGLSKIRV